MVVVAKQQLSMKLQLQPKFRSIVMATMPSAAFDADGLQLYFQRAWVGRTGGNALALSGRTVWVGTCRYWACQCLKNLTRQCLEDAPAYYPCGGSSIIIIVIRGW
jgi:hypothetical protein